MGHEQAFALLDGLQATQLGQWDSEKCSMLAIQTWLSYMQQPITAADGGGGSPYLPRAMTHHALDMICEY
jgi:hypothetical protein